MIKKSLCIANWKMNKTLEEAEFFLKSLTAPTKVEVGVAPPFPYLFPLHLLAKKKRVALLAQTISEFPEGAHTGEVSPNMVKDWVGYVIIGHSERRAGYGETDESSALKGRAILKVGMQPIFCIGEDLSTREQGNALQFVGEQIKRIYSGLTKGWAQTTVVAYDPVWAIGKADAAKPEDVQDMHRFVRNVLGDLYDEITANSIRIIYGGSVNPVNGLKLGSCPDVDGFLVGRASLNVHSFEQVLSFLK